ncbi:hypothetical protein ACIPPM_21960 [Streptomyces sp. NPDC090119]|uniref:hypothetical protein n=1 Tax=Streptomyces sp. NPDC090119 TaxID=3365951 RepID=UPI00380081C3
MTERPYTDDDLRAEAARQHATLTEDPDFMGVSEQMEGRDVTPDGGVAWDDFSDETHATAQHSIHDLINGAADVSRWAVDLGADGLEPSPDVINLDGDNGPVIRVLFAFEPGMPEGMRRAFQIGVAQVIADNS